MKASNYFIGSKSKLTAFQILCLVFLLSCAGSEKKEDANKEVSGDRSSSSGTRDIAQDELELSNALKTFTISNSNNPMTHASFSRQGAEEVVRKLEQTVKSENAKDRANIIGLMAAQRLAGMSLSNVILNARKLVEIEVKTNIDKDIPEVAKLELGLAAVRQGQIGAAEYFFADLSKSKQAKIRAAVATAEGILAMQDDRVPEAVFLWMDALKFVSDYQPALYNLAYVALQAGDVKSAKQYLSSMQDQWFAETALISAERVLGDTQRAVALCNRLLEKKPNYKPALYNCALVEYQNTQNLDKAKNLLERMVKSKSGRADYDDKAFRLISKIDMEKAQKDNSTKQPAAPLSNP